MSHGIPFSTRLLALALVMLAFVSPRAADANGQVLELKRQPAGPYEVALGTIPASPVVGSLHMTMYVADRTSNAFVLNADIRVTGKGPNDPMLGPARVGPLEARNSPADPVYYDINTSVDRAGAWTFTVAVNGELGRASTDFPIEVKEPNPLTAIVTLITLLAFVTIIGFSLRAYLRERGKSKQPKRRG